MYINRCMDKETVIYTYIHTVDYYLVIKRRKILPFAATWTDLEGIMLSQISQTKTNAV